MSGWYYIYPEEGTPWAFDASELMQAAREFRPGAQIVGDEDCVYIDLPGDPSEQAIKWTLSRPGREQAVITFELDDMVPARARMVIELLRRLAPSTPAAWLVDFDGTVHKFRPEDMTADEFVRMIWEF